MVDPGEGLEGPEPSLFLDQTEAQRAEKFFFKTAPPPPTILRCGLPLSCTDIAIEKKNQTNKGHELWL